MNSKNTKAIVLVTTILAVSATLVASFVTGSLEMSITLANPLNIISILAASFTAAVAILLGIMLYVERGKRCQNIECSDNPGYVEVEDDYFKEITGVLDMSLLIDADTDGEEELPSKSALPLTAEAPVVDSIEAAEAREVAAVEAHNVAATGSPLYGNVVTFAGAAAASKKDTASKITSNIAPSTAVSLVPSIEAIAVSKSQNDMTSDKAPVIEKLTPPEIEDFIEEPNEKPCMDFTDHMIPMIISALQKMQNNSTYSAVQADNRQSQFVAERGMAIQSELQNGTNAQSPSSKSAALNGKLLSEDWLYEDGEASGRHFKSGADDESSNEPNNHAGIEKISDYMKDVFGHIDVAIAAYERQVG